MNMSIVFRYFSPSLGHKDAFNDLVKEKARETRTVVFISTVTRDFSQMVKF